MRIAILVEGKTERAFKPYLLLYLQKQLTGKMPKLDFLPSDGRIPTDDNLKRYVVPPVMWRSAATILEFQLAISGNAT